MKHEGGGSINGLAVSPDGLRVASCSFVNNNFDIMIADVNSL